ncbi:hypothetical protein R3P38DRAFT_2843595 [Favolaschia claudopus]|uniref:Uncharacterized protein n=1 Tax=Favolaschia claudopus TaxID=2862362 RepID=A0AAW0E2Q6_9AGAR
MPHSQFSAISHRKSSSNLQEEYVATIAPYRAYELVESFNALNSVFPSVALCPPSLSQLSPPSPEIPGLASDWWHVDTNVRIVNGTGGVWSGDAIAFHPDHGPCTAGISMKMARHGMGMLRGDSPVRKWVHPFLLNVPHPMLSIQWPGYQSIEESFVACGGVRPLNIQRSLPIYGDATLAQVAQQVAHCFFELCQSYGNHCNPHDPQAILLGPNGVNFDRLRLVKLWTSNQGAYWNAEVAIVSDYMRR